jgi:hypothetical protein
MKIIKKENEQVVPSIFPFRTECEYCNTELELDESDAHIGSYGLYDYVCPCCKMKNELDDGINLNKDNLQFPIHYYSFKDGKNISDEEIDKWVKQGIKYLEEHTDEYSWSVGTGDSKVFVQKFDEDNEYSITVCKGYYEVEIPIK